jgi:hypothetical protein
MQSISGRAKARTIKCTNKIKNKLRNLNKTFVLLSVPILVFTGITNGRKKQQSFKPGEIWPGNKGVHINAHGGGIIKLDQIYYWYGEHKAEGEGGNRAMVGVHCYSSKRFVQLDAPIVSSYRF